MIDRRKFMQGATAAVGHESDLEWTCVHEGGWVRTWMNFDVPHSGQPDESGAPGASQHEASRQSHDL